MARRIGRDDPEYQQAMREAKQQFEEAMAKSAMKGRGRPAKTAAKPAAPEAVAIELGELPDDALVEEVLADIPPEEEPVVAAPAKKKAAPRAKAPARKGADRK